MVGLHVILKHGYVWTLYSICNPHAYGQIKEKKEEPKESGMHCFTDILVHDVYVRLESYVELLYCISSI